MKIRGSCLSTPYGGLRISNWWPTALSSQTLLPHGEKGEHSSASAQNQGTTPGLSFCYSQGLWLLRINPRVSKTTHTKEIIKSDPTARDHDQLGPAASLWEQSSISQRPLFLKCPANQGGNRKHVCKAQTAHKPPRSSIFHSRKLLLHLLRRNTTRSHERKKWTKVA